jgi:hypothetical protein
MQPSLMMPEEDTKPKQSISSGRARSRMLSNGIVTSTRERQTPESRMLRRSAKKARPVQKDRSHD